MKLMAADGPHRATFTSYLLCLQHSYEAALSTLLYSIIQVFMQSLVRTAYETAVAAHGSSDIPHYWY